jgi:acetoacetate decarboxylase
MREEIVRGGFSTPLDAPMIPRFPFGFRDVEILTLTYRSDEDAMRGLLPEPLELRGPWV